MARCEWTDVEEGFARFEQHLRWASEEVKSWPLWKQNLWRGGPNRPLATEVIPKPCLKCGGPGSKFFKETMRQAEHEMLWGNCSITYSHPFLHTS